MGFSRQEYWSGVPLPSPLACLVAVKSSALLSYFSLYVICILFSGCLQYFLFIFSVQLFEFNMPMFGHLFFFALFSLYSLSGIPVMLMLDYLML